jgi:uncharacterized protein (TIGR02117 family)
MRTADRFRIGLLLLCAPFAAWGLASLVLGGIGTGARAAADPTNVVIQVETNGAHVSFWFPARHPLHDWTVELPTAHTRSVAWMPAADDDAWISIGWGDRRFFLEVPTWNELTVPIALSALSGGGPSAMHVEHSGAPYPWGAVRSIELSAPQYGAVVDYVRASFRRAADGQPIQIQDAHYGNYDAFYEAVGSYGPLNTCNEWVSRGLRSCGAPAGLWTPFAYQVLGHAPEIVPVLALPPR